jgi:hypothetical protein
MFRKNRKKNSTCLGYLLLSYTYFRDNIRENKYFRENIMSSKYFHKYGPLVSYVADNIFLFSNKLKEKSTFLNLFKNLRPNYGKRFPEIGRPKIFYFNLCQSWALAHLFEVRYPLPTQYFPMDR